MSFGHLSRAGGCLPSADDLVESPDVQVLFCSRGQGLRERRLGRRRGTSAKKTQTSGPLSRSLPVCPHPFPPSSSRHLGSLAPSLSDSGLPDLPPSVRSPSPQSPFLSADVWIPRPLLQTGVWASRFHLARSLGSSHLHSGRGKGHGWDNVVGDTTAGEMPVGPGSRHLGPRDGGPGRAIA